MSILRLVIEIIGWIVTVPVVLYVSIAVADEVLYRVVRRRTDFVRLGRIGFYAAGVHPGSGCTLKDGSEWNVIWDRWCWRKEP